MKIVDSQVHMWYTNTPKRPWLPEIGKKTHRERSSFLLEDLLAEMRVAGIDRAIIVPVAWGFEESPNDRAIEAAQIHPDRLAVMGLIMLDEPESRGKVATWKQQPGMLGVRLSFGGKKQLWLSDGTVDWFWPSAEKAGLGIMLHVPGNLPLVKKIAAQYPGLKLIIDHMGIPHGRKDEAAFAHIGELCEIARFPNVAVKVSALPFFSDEPYPHPKLHKYVMRAYDAFGPKRLFWGSDLTRLPCSYSLCKTMFTEEMKWLSGTDLEWIMGRAVCEWLNWPMQE